MKSLLRRALSFKSISGEEAPFTRFLADWARGQGFDTDLFETSEADVQKYPQGQARHLPLLGRPTLVIRLRGTGNGRSLLFNAHSDVVPAPSPEQWRVSPWSGEEVDGKIYGRGACDVKGPLVGALWAMLNLKKSPQPLAGDVFLELIPGEEDCVGLGTLTSLLRGHRADAAIILEPTESLPRLASRGGLRFEITTSGQSVHGTVKWLGADAIQHMRMILDALAAMEERFNDRAANSLFAPYPIARPITVDKIHGGDWQGMVADHCTCGGYFELLPSDDLEEWKGQFTHGLHQLLPADTTVQVDFPEQYTGHLTDPADPLSVAAQQAVQKMDIPFTTWSAFNSGCEAGLRWSLQKTPTLVWGPGSLAQAHSVDEFVEWREVEAVAAMFTNLARTWCQ